SVTTAHENEIRRSCVLVRRGPEDGTVSVLLRFAGADEQTTRERLLALGFHPNASPLRTAVSWRRAVSERMLPELYARLREALGDAAVLDLGAPFADTARAALRRAREAHDWCGHFLVHIGGTRRCAVFDSRTAEAELERSLSAAREEYFMRDFRAASE
ncbi:MAG: hypothetical protein K0S65_6422, partial [Labilithrix sp.]|nr:hypothetical protein [Labilithrix sp.]